MRLSMKLAGYWPRALVLGTIIGAGVIAFALFYGAVFLGEQITQWMLVCALVIVCGVALSTGLVKLGRQRAVDLMRQK